VVNIEDMSKRGGVVNTDHIYSPQVW
jgi:hypothetical protein